MGFEFPLSNMKFKICRKNATVKKSNILKKSNKCQKILRAGGCRLCQIGKPTLKSIDLCPSIAELGSTRESHIGAITELHFFASIFKGLSFGKKQCGFNNICHNLTVTEFRLNWGFVNFRGKT